MGFLIGSLVHLIMAIFGIAIGLIGLIFGLTLSLVEFIFLGPVIILFVVLGIIFWHPFLWLVLIGGLFFIYRAARRRKYITINRK